MPQRPEWAFGSERDRVAGEMLQIAGDRLLTGQVDRLQDLQQVEQFVGVDDLLVQEHPSPLQLL